MRETTRQHSKSMCAIACAAAQCAAEQDLELNEFMALCYTAFVKLQDATEQNQQQRMIN